MSKSFCAVQNKEDIKLYLKNEDEMTTSLTKLYLRDNKNNTIFAVERSEWENFARKYSSWLSLPGRAYSNLSLDLRRSVLNCLTFEFHVFDDMMFRIYGGNFVDEEHVLPKIVR